MGKALSPIALTKGKIGNVVYYKIKNSADGEKQGSREYVAAPTNPQSDAQIDQRIKMTTVTNCYRAFKDVIRRAFEGVEYGQPSYYYWSRLALGRNFAGPYLSKGVRMPVPVLGVPMSVGSLPQVVVSPSSPSTNNLVTSLGVGSSSFATIGELSQLLVASTPYLRVGDQITLCVLAASTDDVPLVSAESYSFYLNPDDSSPVPSIQQLDIEVLNGQLAIIGGGWEPLAACVIVSREGSHLRSTSYWGVSPLFSRLFVTDPALADIASYRAAAKKFASDWPVNPDASPAQGSVAAYTLDNVPVSLRALRVDGSYLVASGRVISTGESVGEFFFQVTDPRSVLYQKYLASYDSSTATAPSESTADIIGVKTFSDMTEIERNLYNWLIRNGVSERFLLMGDNA